ncbi:MAG: peroxiredoxin-like family protein [Opitutus sp.]
MIRFTLLFFALWLTPSLLLAVDLPLAPEAVKPLPSGTRAPTPELISADGSACDLSRLFREKPTVLIFYRGGWCPFCNRHLAALAECELPLRQMGYQIIAVTPEAPPKLKSTAKENRVRYRLLSDRAMLAAGAYGVAFRVSVETGQDYQRNGIELPVAPDGLGFWQPVPAAFIISREGIVRFVYSNPDPENAISVNELLRAAKAAAKD